MCFAFLVYHAFISYSHRADSRLAPALQRALERSGIPWWKRSPVRIYRDDSSLAASAALWQSIEAGLQQSEFLLLFASPDSAASGWVAKEVQWWLGHRSSERLLIVVTAGQINYDAAVQDFDWKRTDCLPAVLAGAMRSEPLWTDLRFATDARRQNLRDPQFRSAALGLAAAIRGIGKDALESDDARQRRHALRLALATLSGGAVLAAAAGLSFRSAQSESAAAQASRLESQSRRLAAESQVHLDAGRTAAATLTAAIAWRLSATDDARRALRRINEQTSDVTRLIGQHTGSINQIAFTADGADIITAGSDGTALRRSWRDGRLVGAGMGTGFVFIDILRPSLDGRRLLMLGSRQGGRQGIAIFAMPGAERLPVDERALDPLRRPDGNLPYLCAAISPNGSSVFISDGDRLAAIDSKTGDSRVIALPKGFRVAGISAPQDDRLLVLASDRYAVQALSVTLSSGAIAVGPRLRKEIFVNCHLTVASQSGRRFAIYADGPGPLMVEIDDRLALKVLATPRFPAWGRHVNTSRPSLNAAGDRIAFASDGVVYVWNVDAGLIEKQFEAGTKTNGPPVVISGDGRLLAAIDDGAKVWNLENQVRHGVRVAVDRCGLSGLEDECIQRLCDKLTAFDDEGRWKDLLGEEYQELRKALKGTSCASRGEVGRSLQR